MGMFIFGGEEIPDEVKRLMEQIFGQLPMGMTHPGMGAMPRKSIMAEINMWQEEDEPDLTDDQVDRDHERYGTLAAYLDSVIEATTTPLEDWNTMSDGDRLRMVVFDLLSLRAVGPTCIHRQRVERVLLDIADRLDLMDISEGKVSSADDGDSIPPPTRGADTRVSRCYWSWDGSQMPAPHAHVCARAKDHPGRCRCALCHRTTTTRPDGWEHPDHQIGG